MKKYTWFKTPEAELPYAIVHTENGIETPIAISNSAEKADFICKACNQFSLEKYEMEKLLDIDLV